MITIQSTCNDESLEADVDQDIAAFDAWFQARGNEPVVKFEKAILKTFLFFKLKGAKKDGAETSR
jgi:hypothetical protein